MNGFEPGEGWREVSRDEWRRMNPGRGLLLTEEDGDRYWVREEPVAALPTEPYTVIRVDWRKDDTTHDGWPRLLIFDEGTWEGIEHPHTFGAPFLSERITGFEVLAEPRAVTAKAVLDRIQSLPSTPLNETTHALIAREFGVQP